MKQEPTGAAPSAAGGIPAVHGREDVNRRHAHRTPIRLLGGSGRATVADADQLRVDEGANLAVLNRGHSLRIDFPRAHDRMHLWIEAVTALECPEVHDVPR